MGSTGTPARPAANGFTSVPPVGRGRRRWSGPASAAISLAAVLAPLAACGGSSTAASSPAGDVLTIAVPAAPPTLDPAKAHGHTSVFFNELAYEPLIVLGNNGSYQPGLATSWHYVGTGNTTFVLGLRSGVKFSDGSALTAQNVVDHFSYLKHAAGQQAPLFAGAAFTATGPLEVTIKAAKPNPDLVYDMTQDVMAGEVVSENGINNPAELGTRTFGAGPYELAAAQTSPGSQYTYVPNTHYYDKSAQYWKKVVIKIIQSPQATLQSMLSGQVQIAIGDQTTVAQASKNGLTHPSTTITENVTGVTLADRGGVQSKPLSDVRVRQALNFATDRKTIVKALFPGNQATDQMSVPAAQGYDASNESLYPYDEAKARQLLSRAGYPNGFTLNLITTDANSQSLFAQALAQQWRKVGVEVRIDDVSQGNAYVAQALGAKAPAFTNNYAVLPIATEGPNLFLPEAAYNPFRYADPTLVHLYSQDVVASGSAKSAMDKKIVTYLVNQAWFVPVVAQQLTFYTSSNVTGTMIPQNAAFLSLYNVRPAS